TSLPEALTYTLNLRSLPTRRSYDLKSKTFFQYLEQKICSKHHSKVGGKVGVNVLFLIRIHAHVVNKMRPVIISIRNSNKLLYSTFDLPNPTRSEEHTSELQSRFELVCSLMLEKHNK